MAKATPYEIFGMRRITGRDMWSSWCVTLAFSLIPRTKHYLQESRSILCCQENGASVTLWIHRSFSGGQKKYRTSYLNHRTIFPQLWFGLKCRPGPFTSKPGNLANSAGTRYNYIPNSRKGQTAIYLYQFQISQFFKP
jgi:hypothetical protein